MKINTLTLGDTILFNTEGGTRQTGRITQLLDNAVRVKVPVMLEEEDTGYIISLEKIVSVQKWILFGWGK